MRRALLWPALQLPMLLLVLLLSSCDDDHGSPRANLSPSVFFTGGASEAQAVNYKVEFSWLGTDPDGLVDHYEFAVDDTLVWETTESTQRAFIVSADSLAAKTGDVTVIASDFHRWHRLYVRAVDDDGAGSQPARRTFNAFTVAPVTHFLLPVPGGRVSQFPSTVRFKWSGQDDDSSAPDRKPAGYRYKLVHTDNLLEGWTSGAIQDSLGELHDDGTIVRSHANFNWAWPDSVLQNPAIPDSIKKEWIQIRPGTLEGHVLYWDPVSGRWLEIPGNLEERRFEVLQNREYAFAVRAVDEAGAVEPDYLPHTSTSPGNVFIFEVFGDSFPPLLTVCGLVDCFTFPTVGDSVEFEIPAGGELRLSFSARSPGGEEICGFNYGLDIPDPSSEVTAPNGIGGWIGWGMWPGNVTPIRFPPSDDGFTHYLYIRVRDCSGGITTGIIKLKVVAFPFDKRILIIDDFANYVGVSDAEHDAFMDRILRSRFAYADSSEITWIYGPDLDPTPTEPPPPPTLSFLSRYKLVIIYHQESGSNPGDVSVVGNLTSADNPTNARHNPKRRALATYVAAGGKLWVWGVQMAGGLQGDNYRYPKEPLNPAGQETADPETFDEGSFLYGMLHITRGVIMSNGDVRSANVMFGAIPGAAAAGRGYPELEIDRTRFPDFARGINQAETIQGAPLIVAGLDTLYTYRAKAPASTFEGKPTALYYRSPAIPKTQGDIAYFGFYYYYFKEDQLRQMCDRVFEDMFAGP